MRVPIEIANPLQPERRIRVEEALVDTGASRTTLPRNIANDLGLEILGQDQTRTADGVHSIDRSFALIRIEGRESRIPIWISDSYPGVLIGVITLEDIGLAVDPGSGRLTNSEFLLL